MGLATPRAQVAGDCSLVTRQGVLRRLHEAGVEVLCSTQLRWNERFEDEGSLFAQSLFGGPLRPITDLALITYATPRAPQVQLLAALQATGKPVHRIGDCLAPGHTLSATAQGFALGAAI